MRDFGKHIISNQSLYLEKIKKYFVEIASRPFAIKKEINLKNGLRFFDYILYLYKIGDTDFRFVFYYFYQLNRGFPLKEFDDYFDLLNATSSEKDLFDSSIRLLNLSNKYHLSFTTKITNLKYPDFPIIDKHVRHFFGIRRNEHLSYEQMNLLKSVYTEYLVPKLSIELKAFRSAYRVKSISDVKIVDFLIWFNKGA